MKFRFTNENMNSIFSEVDQNGFSELMFETATNQQEVDTKDANEKIREVMFQILGVSEDCSRKDLRRAIRKHKIDIYEVIEETVNNLLVSGWQNDPFFNQFVEMKSMDFGDTNEFYVPYEGILTVSELAGGHHNLIRQKLGEGSTFNVKTSWYGVKIYTEYELFMAGRIDWAAFIEKIYEAFDKLVNDMVYQTLMSAGDKVMPTSQFTKSGQMNESSYDTFMELIEDVQTATGEEVVIMGTKTALSKLRGLGSVDWISSEMKNERYTTGRLGLFEGVRLYEIPQAFAPNDTSIKLVDNTKLLIMPVGDNKFIKLYNEGDSQMVDSQDPNVNRDMSIEAEYQQKLGIAAIINKKFGTWKITA